MNTPKRGAWHLCRHSNGWFSTILNTGLLTIVRFDWWGNMLLDRAIFLAVLLNVLLWTGYLFHSIVP